MEDILPTISHVPGFIVAGVHCGLKKNGALDFALIVSDTPCTAAGVFTTNQVKAAPVLVNMERLKRSADRIRAVAINTGCANACTGQQGIDNALQTARWVAEHIGCAEDEVLVMSTGVIGTQLPMDKIRHGIELAVDSLGENNWEAAARAIMTTDTRPKMASVNVATENGRYTVAGIAKGAGMIAPNMATMLGLVVTDAEMNFDMKPIMDRSFNRIVVDGDMSTNDTVLFLSNRVSPVVHSPYGVYDFECKVAVENLCATLAQAIARDGEGATKFVEIHIGGAPDTEAARKIAMAIATSPLVKTAIYGGDANWGRIIAAAGRAGVELSPEKMRLWIQPSEYDPFTYRGDDLELFKKGMPTRYDEARATEIMKSPYITILLDCGKQGGGECLVWTCDLSHEYVSINADYRS